MAIRNLCLISYRHPEAADILKQITRHPDPELHTVIVHEYAFDALKEANQVASLQILQSLAKDYPLREAIKNAAKITHRSFLKRTLRSRGEFAKKVYPNLLAQDYAYD